MCLSPTRSCTHASSAGWYTVMLNLSLNSVRGNVSSNGKTAPSPVGSTEYSKWPGTRVYHHVSGTTLGPPLSGSHRIPSMGKLFERGQNRHWIDLHHEGTAR